MCFPIETGFAVCCFNSDFEGLGLAYLMSQFCFPDSQAELLCADSTSSAGFLWSSCGVSVPWTFSLGLVSFALVEGVEQDDLEGLFQPEPSWDSVNLLK